MIRLEKMTPLVRGWGGCHFPHSCLFMLNSPWVTARPWQNKIRAPFCTSISLSHGIGWQVSRGEKYCTLCSVLQGAGLSYTSLTLSLGLIFRLSIYLLISLSIFFHTQCSQMTLCQLSFSLVLVSSCLCTSASSLSLPIKPSLCLQLPQPHAHPNPAPPLSASLPGVPRLKTQRGFRFC